jgi:Ca2+-transporting ATPase
VAAGAPQPPPPLGDLEAAHARTVADACDALGVGLEGLSRAEAAARLARFGPNRLPEPAPPGVVRHFFRQFLNPLVYILLAAAVLSTLLQEWSDAGFILAVLVLNAIIGCAQEYGAERSAQALRALSVDKAYVARDGEDRELDASELVVGDVVLLEAGAKVPADVRLISEAGIEVDESLLTGESLPVLKVPGPRLPAATPLAERVNMAFAATMVTRGRGHGLVVATGAATEVGRIARSLTRAVAAKPPLLVRMERFTRVLALGVGAVVVMLGTASVAAGSPIGEVFMLSIALAVAAIPEGLPVALTVALAIGARRMGRRNVIARRLVAVEALGSCTFIVSDKTGTLTRNELAAQRVLLPTGAVCAVSTAGKDPEGEVRGAPEDLPGVQRLAVAAALCNDAFLGLRDGVWTHHGDAVDVALLALGLKVGVHRAAAEAATPRIAEIPFDPERRFSATLHDADGARLVAVKGAPERVLAMCGRMATPEGDRPLASTLEAQADALAAEGYRVLAVAAGPVPLEPEQGALEVEHLHDLVLLGFVGMVDPLRSEVKAAVQACRAAGVDLAVVTGDHPVTALAIARELDLAQRPDQVVTGVEFAAARARGPEEADALVRSARVFARVEPNQKLQIVQTLIRAGHFVAVTGDGANDAPALRAAHIGVAMGERGTDVARESAELILTDDNFSSIVAGIEEGRIAYANVRKVIFLLVSSGAAEVLLFVAALAAGLPAPLWPVQLLWLNLVTNGIQDVALAFEPAEGGELARRPRPPNERIFDRLMLERTLVTSTVMALVAFLAYRWMLTQGWSLPAAQNVLLLLLVLFENIQAGNSRSETTSVFRMNPLRNRLLLVGTLTAQLIHIGAMYTPGLRDILRLQPVTAAQWLMTLGLALCLLITAELHKLVLRRRLAHAP